FFFSSRRRHTRFSRDWSSDVCSSDLRRERQCPPLPSMLSAQAEPLDERTVTRDVDLLQVLQQLTPAADQEQQAPAAVVVVLVGLEVLGQVADALAQQRDLHLGRPGVALGRRVLRDDGLLGSGVERHGSPLRIYGHARMRIANDRACLQSPRLRPQGGASRHRHRADMQGYHQEAEPAHTYCAAYSPAGSMGWMTSMSTPPGPVTMKCRWPKSSLRSGSSGLSPSPSTSRSHSASASPTSKLSRSPAARSRYDSGSVGCV